MEHQPQITNEHARTIPPPMTSAVLILALTWLLSVWLRAVRGPDASRRPALLSCMSLP
jgi:hypothetical protein